MNSAEMMMAKRAFFLYILPNSTACVFGAGLVGLDTSHTVAERRFSVDVLHGFAKEFQMPQGKAVFAGLNQTGLIVFIILFFVCIPLCWIPFIVDSMKGNPE